MTSDSAVHDGTSPKDTFRPNANEENESATSSDDARGGVNGANNDALDNDPNNDALTHVSLY